MLRDNFLRALIWFGVVVVALLVMVRPAAAEIESVLPESNARLSYYVQSSVATTERATPDLSREAYNSAYGGNFVAWGAPVAYSSCGDIATTYSRKMWDSGWTNWKLVLPNCINPTGAITCPAASPAYAFNPTTGMCEREAPACPVADTDAGAYWIAVGTVPTAIYTTGTGRLCKAGCETRSFVTVPRPSGYPYSDGASKMVDGVKQYFSFREYKYTGATCAGDTLPVSAVIPDSDSCAPGQSYVQMGNKIRCLDSSGALVNANSASAVSAAQTLATAQQAAAITAAQQAAQAAGLSASSVEAAQSVAAGVFAAGGGSPGGTAVSSDPVMAQFCQDNPTASVCVDQDFGTVEDSTLGEKTINVAITPVMVGGAGSCPAPTPFALHDGVTRYFQWTTYCNYAMGIKPILLAFAWLSAAGLLVGGFKSA